MTRWEYTSAIVAPTGADELNDRLNRLGNDGWELVSATAAPTGRTGSLQFVVIFKRPKQP